MISNIKDTLVVGLLMIAVYLLSKMPLRARIAGLFTKARNSWEPMLLVSAIVTRCFSTTKINWSFWVGRLMKRSLGAEALFWSQSKTMTDGSLSSVTGVRDGF